jgi:hypothetical protein
MRGIWAKCVKIAQREGEREAVKALARKVREREDVEKELRQERKKEEQKLERNRPNVGRLAEDIRRRCRETLEDIDAEWAKWE